MKPELTTDILAKVGEGLQKQVNRGAWREVKLYLRFLACLQGIFEDDGVFKVLEDLFSHAAELQMTSSEDVRTSRNILAERLLTSGLGFGPGACEGHSPNDTICNVIFGDRARESSI